MHWVIKKLKKKRWRIFCFSLKQKRSLRLKKKKNGWLIPYLFPNFPLAPFLGIAFGVVTQHSFWPMMDQLKSAGASGKFWLSWLKQWIRLMLSISPFFLLWVQIGHLKQSHLVRKRKRSGELPQWSPCHQWPTELTLGHQHPGLLLCEGSYPLFTESTMGWISVTHSQLYL